MTANELDVRRRHKPEYLDQGPIRGIRIGKLIDTPPPVRHGHLELVLEPPQSAARQEI
ncbi:hypothetical protein [Mycobacterium sp. 852002-10029_SCH5224772]|uniref:hypothetical protein n=1 Tax=Mycobacterium sp. 852002-10029_SCH5224772 TaxID=1834083 RepID=UPI000A6B222D|nr:hypothetical protein [Mycobacterium sp. 852002-10029_SCH5224772]